MGGEGEAEGAVSISSSGGEESDSSSPAPAVVEQRVLPKRATRGVRSTRLLGEAAEADTAFWGQSAFEDDGSDEEFSEGGSGSVSTESTDSDIDAPEPEEQEDAEARRQLDGRKARGSSAPAADRPEQVKRQVYVDKAAAKIKAGKGSLGQLVASALTSARRNASGGAAPAAAVAVDDGAPSEASVPHGASDLEPCRGEPAAPDDADAAASEAGAESLLDRVRARQRAAAAGGYSIATDAGQAAADERDKDRIAREQEKETTARARAAKTASSGEGAVPNKLTQAQVLVEAAHTALENERLLAMATLHSQAAAAAGLDASRSRAGGGAGHSLSQAQPSLRFLSRRGCADTLTFTHVDDFPSLIRSKPNGREKRPCEVPTL